jgi:hypothetical protein
MLALHVELRLVVTQRLEGIVDDPAYRPRQACYLATTTPVALTMLLTVRIAEGQLPRIRVTGGCEIPTAQRTSEFEISDA